MSLVSHHSPRHNVALTRSSPAFTTTPKPHHTHASTCPLRGPFSTSLPSHTLTSFHKSCLNSS
ncbi:hypothetical protein PIB30_106707, partial [Stylosanthes scabra]|nr:hypothetical protein [Stylosanthes scabra]